MTNTLDNQNTPDEIDARLQEEVIWLIEQDKQGEPLDLSNLKALITAARINERKRAWRECQDLEGIYNESVSADHLAEIYAILRDVYRYQEDRIKVLQSTLTNDKIEGGLVTPEEAQND